MARIRKKGLDYFPLNTDYVHSRLVRRLMKREGDAAFTVLIQILSYIYGDEGYYVDADEDFYEDLTDYLYEKDLEDVKRIVEYAVELGMFHAGLFRKYGILTEKGIQEQFLFCTKQRRTSVIDAQYCLLTPGELMELEASTRLGYAEKKGTLKGKEKPEKIKENSEEQGLMIVEKDLLFEGKGVAPLEQKGHVSFEGEEQRNIQLSTFKEKNATEETGKSGGFAEESSCSLSKNSRNETCIYSTKTAENGTKSTENVQLSLINAHFMYFGTQSIEKHSIAKHRSSSPQRFSSKGEPGEGEPEVRPGGGRRKMGGGFFERGVYEDSGDKGSGDKGSGNRETSGRESDGGKAGKREPGGGEAYSGKVRCG